MTTTLASILAAAIAFLGVCIAWGQWYTARQKLVLDLFVHRFTAYDTYRAALDEINDLNNRTPENLMRLEEYGQRVRFLFGPDVSNRVAKISGAFYVWHQRERAFMRASEDVTAAPEELKELMAKASNARDRVLHLREELEPFLLPYLLMDQRLPRSPLNYLREKGYLPK